MATFVGLIAGVAVLVVFLSFFMSKLFDKIKVKILRSSLMVLQNFVSCMVRICFMPDAYKTETSCRYYEICRMNSFVIQVYDARWNYEQPLNVTCMMQNEGMEAIPSDLIIEILSRIPVKELGKLRCVCRQWYRLLTCNKEFMTEHMKHTKRKPLLLLRRYSSNFFMEVKKNKVSVELTAIDLEGTVINNFRTVVDGPVHTFVSSAALAILCCMKSLYVFNPSTGQGVSVPCSSAAASFYTIGFGYLPQSNEYKIIHLFFVPSVGQGKMRSEILTLRDGEGVMAGSWRSIRHCPQSVSASDCLCLNGNVFWEVTLSCNGAQGKEIASFDLSKEEFKVHSHPVCDSTKYSMMGLTGFQETLSVMGFAAETSTMDVWLMKNNNSGIWVKEYTVDLFSFDAETLIPWDYCSGDILISTKQKDLIKYSIRNQTSTNISYSRTIGTCRKPCLYYESLFSLHKPI